MIGGFFSQLGAKLQADAEDKSKQQQNAVNDLFKELSKTKTNGASVESILTEDDPMQFFCSPEKPTAKPNVSKQKPILSTSQAEQEPQAEVQQFMADLDSSSSQNEMPQMSLFKDQREAAVISTRVQPVELQDSKWAADDDLDIQASSSDESQQPLEQHLQKNDITREEQQQVEETLSVAQEPSPPQPAAASSRKRDLFSNMFSTAGGLIVKGAAIAAEAGIQTGLQNAVVQSNVQGKSRAQTNQAVALSQDDQEKVISVLKEENLQLKAVLTEQQQKVEDLQDEIEVHQSLEEEAHEANEELLYKVKYLEELSRENGHDLSSLKKIQELGQEKKSLQSRVNQLERQLRLLEKLKLCKDDKAGDRSQSGIDEEEFYQNPRRALNDLKSLFEHNKIHFSKSDEAKVLTAIYTQDKPVVRLYRELLFRRIAQKAIQSAENLFKLTESKDRDGNQMCKLLIDNKNLATQNEALKKQLQEAQNTAKKASEEITMVKVKNKHKLNKVHQKAKVLSEQTSQMRQAYLTLKDEVLSQQGLAEDEDVINLNIQRFNSYLSYFMDQQQEKQLNLKEEFEKQKILLIQQKTQLQEQAQQARIQYQETLEQVAQQSVEKVNVQEELGEAQETINHMEQEMNRLVEEHSEEKTASSETIALMEQKTSLLEMKHQQEKAESDEMITKIEQEVLRVQEEHQEEQAQSDEQIQRIEQEMERMQQQHLQEIQASQVMQNMLQQEIQALQAVPQGSPISGVQQPDPTPAASSEAVSATIQQEQSSQTQQQISELEKMLEEREEEIIELMDEVNKLQEQQQQSPEVVNALQFLKSKLANSQQRFQDQQQHQQQHQQPRQQQQQANLKKTLNTPLQSKTEEKKVENHQHVPILIEDQGTNNGDKSSQGSQLVAGPPSPDRPRNHQTTDNFNANVRAKLEKVQYQRMDDQQLQPSPDIKEPSYSRIEKDGKDSNFMNSLVFGNSTEKSNENLHSVKKMNDLFGFLQEEAKQPKETNNTDNVRGQLAFLDNWNEAFGLSNVNSKVPPTESLRSTLSLGDENIQEAQSSHEEVEQIKAGWNSQEEDLNLEHLEQISEEKNLEQGTNEQITTQQEQNIVNPDVAVIQIDLGYDNNEQNLDQRGEILLQESLENSPIKQSKLEQNDKQNLIDQANDQQNESENLYESPEIHKLEREIQKMGSYDSHHKRQKKIQVNTGDAFLDGSLEHLGREINVQSQDDSANHNFEENEQKQSYQVAIESFQDNQDQSQSQDMCSMVYDQLMDGEANSGSNNDSLLQNSPFDNTFTRNEVDMVVSTMRKGSAGSVELASPQLHEEKKLNISNLSDLVPEDPIPEKMNEVEDENYHRLLRPGSLNLVEEVDEDISDDMMPSPRGREVLPASIHEYADSAKILDMQSSQNTRKASKDYQKLIGHGHTPSMTDGSLFQSIKEFDFAVKEIEIDQASKISEEIKEMQNNEDTKKASKFKDLLIPESDGQQQQRVISARESSRKESTLSEENPFAIQERFPTQQSDDSQQNTPRDEYDNLAEFTKENLITYQADGKTESAFNANDYNEPTADFDDSKQSQDEDDHKQANLDNSEDRPPVPRNVNGSGFFSRDFRILKNATYGSANQGDMILKRLQQEHGFVDDTRKNSEDLAENHEQNFQSFQEPPVPEPEISACSIQANQLMENNEFHMLQNMNQSLNMEETHQMAQMNNMSRGESFENSFRASLAGSIVDNGRAANSLLGSLLPGNYSIEEPCQQSIEEEQYSMEDDGVPQVDMYEMDAPVICQQESSQIESMTQDEFSKNNDLDREQNSSVVDYEDDVSLETIDVAKSKDVSPVKFNSQATIEVQEEVVIQSNNQDDIIEKVVNKDANMMVQTTVGGAGWDDDESLEEIDTPRELIESPNKEGDRIIDQKQEYEDELNRSISANEQISDALEVPVQKSLQNSDSSDREKVSQQQEVFSDQIIGSGLQQNESRRQDTPIPDISPPYNEQESKVEEVKGWAEDSEDISIDDDELGVPDQVVQEMSQMNEDANEEKSLPQVDLSSTQLAEIGSSKKFQCPNDHQLAVVDGKQQPLPSQECSAYCGMANKQNSSDWLRCRDCFYNVCYDCYHCENGHEMQAIKMDQLIGTPEFDELVCSSCGNDDISGKLWICESIAREVQSGGDNIKCQDKRLICQECLGSGISLCTSKNQISMMQNSIQMNDSPDRKHSDAAASLFGQFDEQKNTAAPQNEQLDFLSEVISKQQIAQPKIEDLFAFATQKQEQVIDDPFSMLIGTTNTSAKQAQPRQKLDIFTNTTPAVTTQEPSTTEVSGTGGGWGDDEDDIDIE